MRVDLDQVALAHAAGGTVLSGLDLHVSAGQICVVMGASGAGKTSLLRLLGGQIAVAEGSLRLDGALADAAFRRENATRIGQIYQDHRLVMEASGADNIAHGAAGVLPLWRNITACFPREMRRRAVMLAGELKLEEALLSRPVSQLSGGQQQRIGIARALMVPRGLILADEPVSSLDPELAMQALGVLRRHAGAMQATVICSLHQPDLARSFADRIVVLAEGSIVFDGPPQSLGADLAQAVAA